MEHGTVKFFNIDKGFGFIISDDAGPDLFFHISQRARAETGTPGSSDDIYFVRQQGRKGPEAGRWQLTKEVTKQPIETAGTVDLVNGPEKDRKAGYRPGVLILLRWRDRILLGRREGTWTFLTDAMQDASLRDPLPVTMTDEELIAALTAPPSPAEEERIAAFWRRQEQIPGWRRAWGVPQGGVEPGETCVQAICRELEEELGDYTASYIDDYADEFPPTGNVFPNGLYSWSKLIKGEPRFLFKDTNDFRVEKDGRVYRGKTLYAFLVDLTTPPANALDWIVGDGDEWNSLPCPEFEGGALFCTLEHATELVRETQKGPKGDQLRRLIQEAHMM